MARDETIDTPLERAYRDRTIVVLLAELGLRGAELFRDPNDDAVTGFSGETSISRTADSKSSESPASTRPSD